MKRKMRSTLACGALLIVVVSLPARAFGIDFASGPAIVATLQAAYSQASQQLAAMRTLVAHGRETLVAMQEQKRLWQLARSSIANPDQFLADSATTWRDAFGALAAAGQPGAFGEAAGQSWRATLGVLKEQGERRLEGVRGAVLAGLDHEHRQLQDHHDRVLAHFERGYGHVSARAAALSHRLNRGEAAVQTILPVLNETTANIAQGMAVLNGRVFELQNRLDHVAQGVRAGIAVGQAAEQRWHDDLKGHVVRFRARPASGARSRVEQPLARRPTGP